MENKPYFPLPFNVESFKLPEDENFGTDIILKEINRLINKISEIGAFTNKAVSQWESTLESIKKGMYDEALRIIKEMIANDELTFDEAVLQGIIDDVERLKAQIEENNIKVDFMQTTVDNLDTKVNNFDNRLATFGTDIDNLKKQQIVEKGTNYIRFNNGIQLCWGNTTIETNGQETTGLSIYYPKPFNAVPITNIQTYSSSIHSSYFIPRVRTKTNTSCTVSFWELNFTYKGNMIGVDWFAIGTWK